MDLRDSKGKYVNDSTATMRLPARTVSEEPSSAEFPILEKGEMVSDAYRVLDIIGQGGMGVVYRVEQVYLRQQYALKTLNSRYSPRALMRFQKEAQAASALRHPNVVSADNFGLLENGMPYLVMDLALGETLSQIIKRGEPLSVEAVLEIILPVCSALSYAHSKGVVHRDIKPSNIVITKSEFGEVIPRIVDFGIARLTDCSESDITRTGEIFGTPYYMSPEQCLGQAVDQRTDIYALGCVMFEALTGAPPFCGEAPLIVMMKHQVEEPASLKQASLGGEFPQALENVVARALAKDVRERYQSCQELEQDLRAVASSKPAALDFWRANSKDSLKFKGVSFPWQSLGFLVVALFIASLFNLPGPPARIEPVVQQTPATIGTSRENLDALYSTNFNRQYFSKIVGQGKDARRIFDFGAKPIGRIGWQKRHSHDIEWHDAAGIFSFEAATPLLFQLGTENLIENHVDVLRAFRADDLDALEMRDHPEAWIYTDKIDDQVFDEALMFGSQLKSIRRLDLKAVPVTAEGLKNMRIDEFPNLRILNLTKTLVNPEDLSHLKVLKQLQELAIKHVMNVAPVLKALKYSQNIKTLELAATGLKDSDFSMFADMPNLEMLTVNDNHHITNKALTPLVALKHLKHLQTFDCAITPEAMPTLAKMTSLTYLTLPDQYWHREDLQQLHKLLPQCTLVAQHGEP